MTGPLADIRVLDLSTVLAGPGCARYLADYGADVIKVERPGRPEPARNLGWRDESDGETLFFKGANRNKRFVEIDLSTVAGRDHLLTLVASSRVLVENLRPGKLDALGLPAEVLWEARPDLVITRVTAFGQDGPYRDRPGFATLAEAMSGFASINGAADGPPTLPPVALTDEVTAIVAAFATMVALHAGVGQEVDANLMESIIGIMGPLPTLWALNQELQPRLGSGLPYSVPRGVYRTSDDRWLAVSASADSVAERTVQMIGLGGDPRVATAADRMANRDAIDAQMAAWVGERTLAEAQAAFEAADAAAAPVYDVGQLLADPHIVDRAVMTEAANYPLPNVAARLSVTPGRVRHPGRPAGTDNEWLAHELVGAPFQIESDRATIVVDPQGGVVRQINLDGHDLLVAADPESGRVRGSFPMVPWAGRVDGGRFRFDGTDYQLPVTNAGNAIHGVGRHLRWDRTGPAELTLDLAAAGGDWPFGGVVTQRFELDEDGVTMAMEVVAADVPMPVMVGWHPWFRSEVGGQSWSLDLAADAMWEVDDRLIPTGAMVDVPTGPWDNCFSGVRQPVGLSWGAVGLTLTSSCDAWVVFTEPTDALCVEPQSQAPNSFNRRPAVLEPHQRFSHWFGIGWSS